MRRCGVLEADVPPSALPRLYVHKNIAELMVRRLQAVRLGKHLIQRIKIKAAEAVRSIRSWWDGVLGRGQVIPFSKPTDGHRLHYDIPHCGDIGIWRHQRKLIPVSSRALH